MKILIPACFILSGAASLAAFAARPATDTNREIIGRIPAKPDVVLEWNAEISDHFEEFSLASTPHIQAHVYAMVHLAMRDAIAETSRESRDDTASTITKSAASAAAHDVIVALRPGGVNRFASLQARQVAAIASDAAASHGRQVGHRIAASVLSSRSADGWPTMLSRSTAEKAALDSLRPTATKRPTPFVLKRVQQFEPEPPYYAYPDGVVAPNMKLRNKKFLGTADAVVPPSQDDNLWRTETIVRWNRVGQSLAVQQPQDLHARARLFAALNMALADTLLAATYWNEAYSNGHVERPIEALGPLDVIHFHTDDKAPPHPAGQWWVANRMSGFPAVPAALAGAAETILRSSFTGEAAFALPANASNSGAPTDFTSLRSAARRCAWASLVESASSPEGCVAGYDLGNRIAGHLLKQIRR